MAAPVRRLLFAVACITAALCLGCSSDESNPMAPGSYDDSSLRAADSLLALAIAAEMDSDPQRPSDIDLNVPYAAYSTALASPNLSPSNRLRARFGVAVLSMMILATDTEVNAAFDEWSAYLENRIPFEAPGSISSFGIPSGLAGGRRALGLPFDVVPRSIVAQVHLTLGAPDPQISRIQAILRDRVLPRLTEVVNHLNIVTADPAFQFIVTPEMQGDPLASPIEIDRTDALALRAASRLLAAMCHVAVAYELNFPAYDQASLLEAIEPGSDWLALLGNGASHMQGAHGDLVGSVDDVGLAIQSLLAESDDQDDDVIRVGPSDLSQASLDSIQTRLAQVRQGLTSGFTLTDDWDGNAGTPDVPLTINVRGLFDTPVQDWKALLPPYTGSVVERPFDHSTVFTYEPQQVQFTVPSTASYNGYYTLNVSGGNVQEYSGGSAEIVDPLRAMIQARYANVVAQPEWAGDYAGSSSFFGNLTAGSQQASVDVSEYYSIATHFVYVPVITWDATQYSEWQFPDPTFSGLLPGFTSTDDLLSTFGYDPATWEQVVVLDWTGGGSPAAHAALRPARRLAVRAR